MELKKKIFPDIDLLEEIDFEDENALANIEIDTMISIPVDIDTAFILTLNGLVLTEGLDYTYSGDSIVYFNAPLIPDDVVTLIYTANGVNPIKTDIYQIMTVIPSGATDEQGSFTVYYNTTTSKYEVFTSAKPLDFNSVLLMVNGAVLANGVDFYQSISNPRRIILNGDLVLNDIITINYFPDGVVGNLLTDLPTVSWFITPAPNKNNGLFTFELATDYNFNNIVYSATTDYVIDAQYYSLDYPVTGFEFGDRLFYRVRNDKNYETICGDIVNTFAYSDKIEITISTNTINSY
jgi:predicted RNA-binding protein